MAGFSNQVPSLVREVLYAPDVCPPSVALLLEVALTHHNTGSHEAAIHTYMEGLSEWESLLKKQHFPELEAAENTTFMQKVKRLEQQERAHAKMESRQKKADDAAAGIAVGATTTTTLSNTSASFGGLSLGAKSTENNAAEIDDLLGEELERERVKQEEEDESLRKKTVEAAHQANELVPVAGKIFLSLAVGSVYESAANDEAALAEYLVALRHLTSGQIFVFRTNLLSATVYSCLGSVYFHLGQYDFSADYYFRALEVRENVLPENHVDIAGILNNLGVVLFLMNRTNDALTLMYRAQAALETQLPVSHPRRELVDGNIRKVKGQFYKEDSSVPPAPFVPLTIPQIPGVVRSKKMMAPKVKKKVDDKKKR